MLSLIHVRNQAGWVTAMLGLIRAGALPAAVNWRLAAPEVLPLAADGAQPAPPERPVSRLHPSEPAILVHTSGNTGRPKLVPLTHQQLITAVVFMKLEVPEAVPGARHLSALPLFHVAGLANLSWARERLAGFKCPTGVTVVPELPRNATGKVLRAQLHAPFWTDRERQVS